MEGKIWDKFANAIGIGVQDDLEEGEEEVSATSEEIFEENELDIENFGTNKKQNKIVNIHTATSAKVVIIKPQNYDEAKSIVDNLKSRKIVLVNINGIEQKVGQRILDFLIGAVYSLEGDLQQVEKGVFILCPSNVEVTNDLKNELSSKGLFGLQR
ncbi:MULTISPECIES: cell division protein SepF [Clostridium]|uniref:Cell division protein SepF n=1 Tax=Clostridium senegalense TaxID=1465809 RepID=A0A6M0H1P3_9CLOT|nr:MULTISPECIES: cell division protein SepF [Clostridium]MBU5225341.1 cell division protein SepF [Clostridium senegalense]NEU03542.1 cell division protein SepF [Clostridium senegalense]